MKNGDTFWIYWKYRTLYLRFIYQEMKSCAKMKLVFIFGQCIMTIMCLYSVFVPLA